jgi:hypothetical protein
MMHQSKQWSRVALFGVALILLGTMAMGHASADTLGPETTSLPTVSTESAANPMSSDPQCKNAPLLMAEGSNSCEIVSCGMGIKDTCKITCPPDKTPKCSCDCLKSFGPICTEYKANCRCE